MRRRAGSAVAAALVLVTVGATAAIGAPAATVGTTTATAGTTTATAGGSSGTGLQSAESAVSIEITGMTPREALPRALITVSGTITNTSAKPVRDLSVDLLSSSTPITSQAYLEPGAAELAGLASTIVPGATSRFRGLLQPRATVHWSIQLKDSRIGMSVFGVYPIEARVLSMATQLQLASALTYLPYTPRGRGPDGYSVPRGVKISWIWPLISTPLLVAPGQSYCQGRHARALAASLSSTGRLGQLIAAGGANAGSADAYGSAAGISRRGHAAGEAAAARNRPVQDLAGYDGITWAIDPALLWDAQSLAGCHATEPVWARAASTWLAELSSVSAGQPMFVTPYADPDAGSLISAGLSGDATHSFSIGRAIASQILHRDLSPATTSTAAAGPPDSAAVYWPPAGTAGYTQLEALAAGNLDIRTALLSSATVASGSPTVSRFLNGVGGYISIVLASQSLTQLLLSDRSTTMSAFATGQQFLAQTALLAQQDPGQPIVVAPPQRWDPGRGIAAELLAATASASWLSPASLTSLTSARNMHRMPSSALPTRAPVLGRYEKRLLASADSAVSQLELLKASADQTLYQRLATYESSAWRRPLLKQLLAFSTSLTAQEHDVQIVAEKRVTLGGLRGSVPVSIHNGLGYQVRVKLSASAPNGFKVVVSPPGLIIIQPHDSLTVRLHVTASAVGSNTVGMVLLNKNGQRLTAGASPTKMTIQATQVGVLGAIVCAIALGIFLIAYAARAVRRGRPAPADEPADTEAADSGPGDSGPGDVADQSTARAEPDTVMGEQKELGAAGTPGPLQLRDRGGR